MRLYYHLLRMPSLRKTFIVFSATLLLVSCGTAYKSSPHMDSYGQQMHRQEVISRSIQNQFEGSKTYLNIDFGDEYVVKPPSFRPLDSLYAVKYQESNFGGTSRTRELQLDQLIDSVLPTALKDTDQLKYEINHVFALQYGDSSDFISGTFLLNSDDSIEDVSIDFQYSDHKKYTPYFMEFLKRQSFMYDQYDPEDDEKKLYTFMEKGLDQQVGAERKGAFISHITHVMMAANLQKSLATEGIVKQLIVDLVTANTSGYTPVAWSAVWTNYDTTQQITGYTVQHEWKYKDKLGNEYHLLRQFDMDIYFQVISIGAIDKVTR